MRKSTLLVSLSFTFAAPLFLVATQCKNPWEKFKGVTVLLKDPSKPITTITLDDFEFKFNNPSQSANYEIKFKDLIRNVSQNKIIVKYRVLYKLSNEISDQKEVSFQLTAPISEINKVALGVKFELTIEAQKKKPSEIDKNDLIVVDLEEDLYELDIKELNPNDEEGTLKISYSIRSIDEGDTSDVIEYTISLKDDINSEARKVVFGLVDGKTPSQTLPSDVKKTDLKASEYNTSIYNIEIKNLNPNNSSGTLGIKFILSNTKTGEKSQQTIFQLKGLKKKTNSGGGGGGGGSTSATSLKLAHWNVCNFGDNSLPDGGKPKAKAHAIASIIHNQQYDIVGLTELDSINVSPVIVGLLNELETKKGTGNTWSYVTGDYEESMGESIAQISHGDRAADYLYKSNKVAPVEIDGKLGHFYDATGFENHFNSDLNEYARTPFCVKWQLLNQSLTNKDFAFAISHFDGPGKGKTSSEPSANIGGSVGAREANEAWNIPNVMKWMETKFNEKDIVFEGDTNIPKNKSDAAFGSLTTEKMLLDESFENYSSLKTTEGEYKNPYDKIILKSDLQYSDPGLYKLWDFVNQDIFGWQSGITSYSEWENYCSKNYPGSITSQGAVYNYISDHCPIHFTLNFN
ncbi:lipoprotein 17-related variable surface protein [Metamycoplasma hyosynoviae]|uniref:MnuA family membrane nuclease n=2 Tax=Metamycoplasma hyosynoviae TaxID=29559 RepID=UPI00235891DF|nr:lipoprotein 17-related variable surface protein [Metamycoplasma hyosynoviae]MDC8921525.1 lipoprotein 17-related variable surface protein [Metamycoplasma hyosynoviae]MDD1371565.1 lipoprotein 17-related variable surface protein [Metamycoplasma hyosynoviae]